MGNKRSHDCGGVSSDISQKKQKYSTSSSDNSLLLNPTSLQVSESEKDTRSLAGSPLQSEYSHANVHYADLSKALNFPVSHQPSSDRSTQHHPFSKPAKAAVTFSPYDGRPSTLPPLPRILEKTFESAAFTHPGSLSCDTASKVNISYDRLEFLGDAYIELMATRVIFPRFPNLTAGRLSQQREMLVKNETLAEYALAYRFDEKAKLPSNYKYAGQRQQEAMA